VHTTAKGLERRGEERRKEGSRARKERARIIRAGAQLSLEAPTLTWVQGQGRDGRREEGGGGGSS